MSLGFAGEIYAETAPGDFTCVGAIGSPDPRGEKLGAPGGGRSGNELRIFGGGAGGGGTGGGGTGEIDRRGREGGIDEEERRRASLGQAIGVPVP